MNRTRTIVKQTSSREFNRFAFVFESVRLTTVESSVFVGRSSILHCAYVYFTCTELYRLGRWPSFPRIYSEEFGRRFTLVISHY